MFSSFSSFSGSTNGNIFLNGLTFQLEFFHGTRPTPRRDRVVYETKEEYDPGNSK